MGVKLKSDDCQAYRWLDDLRFMCERWGLKSSQSNTETPTYKLFANNWGIYIYRRRMDVYERLKLSCAFWWINTVILNSRQTDRAKRGKKISLSGRFVVMFEHVDISLQPFLVKLYLSWLCWSRLLDWAEVWTHSFSSRYASAMKIFTCSHLPLPSRWNGGKIRFSEVLSEAYWQEKLACTN